MAVVATGSEAVAAATKVACVGDSITYGLLSTTGHSYPEELQSLLGPGYQVMNFGRVSATMMMDPPDPGTVSYWDSPQLVYARQYAPDIVVIMLGTNDSTGINWNGGTNFYLDDYYALVDLFGGLSTNPEIFLAAPPPAVKDSFGISGPTIANDIRRIVRWIASNTGSGFVDVYGAFQPDPTPYFGTGVASDQGDGIHPNDLGHQKIAETVHCTMVGTCTSDFDAGTAPPHDASVREVSRHDAGDTIDAGDGGATGMGGSGGTGGGGGAGGTAPVPHQSGGCSCEVDGRSGASAWMLGVAMAAMAFARRRSRPRSTPPRDSLPAAGRR